MGYVIKMMFKIFILIVIGAKIAYSQECNEGKKYHKINKDEPKLSITLRSIEKIWDEQNANKKDVNVVVWCKLHNNSNCDIYVTTFGLNKKRNCDEDDNVIEDGTRSPILYSGYDKNFDGRIEFYSNWYIPSTQKLLSGQSVVFSIPLLVLKQNCKVGVRFAYVGENIDLFESNDACHYIFIEPSLIEKINQFRNSE